MIFYLVDTLEYYFKIIFYFLLKTKRDYTFMLLFSILCFELFHTFSHIIHIKGLIQINIIHSLVYFVNLAFFYLFYCYTKKFPRYEFMLFFIVIVCFDLYAIYNLSTIYYIATQSVIFISLPLYYFSLMPKFIQKIVYKIIFFVGIVILFILNETYHCKKMLGLYMYFPYHIFIEITGIILFYIICSNFYKL